jgi:hypothetical protein
MSDVKQDEFENHKSPQKDKTEVERKETLTHKIHTYWPQEIRIQSVPFFLLTIVLSAFRYMASDYLFDIFKFYVRLPSSYLKKSLKISMG